MNHRKSYRHGKYDREYERYVRKCISIPKYILKNLSNMSNNTGYIWKKIHCYGDKPVREGEPIVLFEKPNRETLLIHEWTKTHYRIFEKKGKGRKYLVFETNKERKKTGRYDLSDYIK